MNSYEKLHVYQLSLRHVSEVYRLVSKIPRGNSDLQSQLKRASTSVTLNIAEGAGKVAKSDKRHFYAIARGSAMECGAIWDVLMVTNLVSAGELKEVKGLSRDIVNILTRLCMGKR